MPLRWPFFISLIVLPLLLGTAHAYPLALLDAPLSSFRSSEEFLRVLGYDPSSDVAFATAIDSTSNVYTVGTTCGAFSGFTNAGLCDCFLIKHNSSGTQQWVKQFGTAGIDACLGVTVDSTNAIYITGFTTGAFPGYTNLGNTDVIMFKYTNAGVQTWARQFGTSGYDFGNGIGVDGSSRPIVVGSTTGTFASNTNKGGTDMFITRYTSAGALGWLEQYGTSGDDEALAVSLDSSNRNFVTGCTSGAFSGNTNKGGVDGFATRINANGNQAWVAQFGTSARDCGTGITAILSSGITKVVGVTRGAFSGFTNAGGDDLFLTQYALNGTFGFVRQAGTSADDSALSVGVDTSGNTFLIGATYGAFSGYSNQGRADTFLQKYNNTGTLQWTRQLGTAEDDALQGGVCDASGNTVFAGYTRNAFPGYTDLKGDDALLVKYNTSGTQTWLRQFGTN